MLLVPPLLLPPPTPFHTTPLLPTPTTPTVGMFISGHLGDRVDLRYFLTGMCGGAGVVDWGGWVVGG